MKNFVLIIVLFFAFGSFANVNSKVPYKRLDSDHLKQVITNWDAEKGTYLYESISALIMNEEQPTRPVGMNNTAFELLQMMDENRIARLENIVRGELTEEKENAKRNQKEFYWQEWLNIVSSARCSMTEGKANGDPHMTTFDGLRYDFQNAGDYLLAGSYDNSFQVQTQMFRPSQDSKISQIGAVALNVNGDIVEFASATRENGGKSIFVNGESLLVENADYILPNGGVISFKNGKNHIIKWPTGEQVQVRRRGSKTSSLFDVFVKVPECKDYYGLLGNNNGDKGDDLYPHTTPENVRTPLPVPPTFEENFGPSRRQPEVINRTQERGHYISYVFSHPYILTADNSMFTSQMVDIADHVRYPADFQTLANVSDEDIAQAIQMAKEAGFEDEDLYEAVYDYVHVGLEPELFADAYSQPQPTENYSDPVINTTSTNSTINNSGSSSTNTNNGGYGNQYPNNRYPNTYPPRNPRPVYYPTYPPRTPSTPPSNPNNGRRTPDATPSPSPGSGSGSGRGGTGSGGGRRN